jgi:hypothetical protein
VVGRCKEEKLNCTSHEGTIKLIRVYIYANIIRWEVTCFKRRGEGASLMLIKRFWQPQITVLVCKLALRKAASPTLKTTAATASQARQIKINYIVSWRDKSAFILFCLLVSRDWRVLMSTFNWLSLSGRLLNCNTFQKVSPLDAILECRH